MKRLIVLGASGSIGLQTVDVVRQHPTQFKIVALSVGKRISVLRELLAELTVEAVCVQSADDAAALGKEYPHLTFFYGDEGLLHLVKEVEADMVVNALMGFVGLRPTLEAIKAHKDVALANKETLVAGGQFVKQALDMYRVNLYPIDSEHSAIFQCMQGNPKYAISRIIITASGGSFRDKTRDELRHVTVEDALRHPNWSMGAKITIDSATMLNKGLEVIEAHWLFNLPYDKIDTILHRESVIHSMVEFNDTAVIAQLGTPDMRLPIQYALMAPDRMELQAKRLRLEEIGSLHFEPLSQTRYPLLKLAYEVGRKGGTMPAIMNGANEAAVQLFLDGSIGFLEIEELVIAACHELPNVVAPTLDDVFAADAMSRRYVYDFVKRKEKA